MRATQTLPEGYREIGTIDISKKRTLLLVSLLGLILMCIFSVFFTMLLYGLRPMDFNSDAMNHPFGIGSLPLQVLGLLVLLAAMLVMHEALHGACFWLFTRARPRFAFKKYYAYASLPDWYLPRDQYLICALMPFVFITLLVVVLLAILPATWFIPMLLVIVSNAAGSVGDLVVAGWLLFRKRGVLAQDRGDAVSLFEPE